MTKDNRIFKIRNIDTGLYSTGGMWPRWTKTGKTWSGTGPLRTHLAQHLKGSNADLSKWRVVEIEVREVAAHEVHEMLNAKQMLKLLTKGYD